MAVTVNAVEEHIFLVNTTRGPKNTGTNKKEQWMMQSVIQRRTCDSNDDLHRQLHYLEGAFASLIGRHAVVSSTTVRPRVHTTAADVPPRLLIKTGGGTEGAVFDVLGRQLIQSSASPTTPPPADAPEWPNIHESSPLTEQAIVLVKENQWETLMNMTAIQMSWVMYAHYERPAAQLVSSKHRFHSAGHIELYAKALREAIETEANVEHSGCYSRAQLTLALSGLCYRDGGGCGGTTIPSEEELLGVNMRVDTFVTRVVSAMLSNSSEIVDDLVMALVGIHRDVADDDDGHKDEQSVQEAVEILFPSFRSGQPFGQSGRAHVVVVFAEALTRLRSCIDIHDRQQPTQVLSRLWMQRRITQAELLSVCHDVCKVLTMTTESEQRSLRRAVGCLNDAFDMVRTQQSRLIHSSRREWYGGSSTRECFLNVIVPVSWIVVAITIASRFTLF